MLDLSVYDTRTVHKYRGGSWSSEDDDVAAEYAFTIYIGDDEFATVVCTPEHLEEMVTGFLASEGVIRKAEEIIDLSLDTNNGMAYVELSQRTRLDPALYSKRRITSCCGKSRQSFYFFSDAQTAKRVESDLRVTPEQCLALMDQLHASSDLHRDTGGVHNAALCTTDGIIVRYSDIGRHNALDKLYGHVLREGIATDDKLLAISGRISSEMLLKAAKIGVPVLLSKSAPTDLALSLAEELGVTAVGFIRGNRMNVYTYPERIFG